MRYKVRGSFYVEKIRGWWYLFGGNKRRLVNAPTDRYKISPPKSHTEAIKIAKRML